MKITKSTIQQPRQTPARLACIERMKHANDLIGVISKHGRRFFRERSGRVAEIVMSERGRLSWIDEYTGTKVSMERAFGAEPTWRGFSHGGTLQSLAILMREYIKTGNKIPLGCIAGIHWGYVWEATQACREEAKKLEIIES